jgi:hypothetical protein
MSSPTCREMGTAPLATRRSCPGWGDPQNRDRPQDPRSSKFARLQVLTDATLT